MRAFTKKLVRENIDWNYIGSSAWLGSQDPLVLAIGRGRDHSRNIKLTTRTFKFASNRLFLDISQRIDLVFFTVTKETVGAFFLGTQGLNLASFGFRSPFQSQWKFVSPNAYLFEGTHSVPTAQPIFIF